MLEVNLWIGRHKRFIYQRINRTISCANVHVSVLKLGSQFLLTPSALLETCTFSTIESAEMTRIIDLFYSYSEFPHAKNCSNDEIIISVIQKKNITDSCACWQRY